MGSNLAGRAHLHSGPAWLKVLGAPVPSVGNGACFWGCIWASTCHSRPREPLLTPLTTTTTTTDLSSVLPGRTWGERSCLGLEPRAWEGCTGPRAWWSGLLGLLESLSGRGWPLQSDGGSHLMCPSACSRTGGRGAGTSPSWAPLSPPALYHGLMALVSPREACVVAGGSPLMKGGARPPSLPHQARLQGRSTGVSLRGENSLAVPTQSAPLPPSSPPPSTTPFLAPGLSGIWPWTEGSGTSVGYTLRGELRPHVVVIEVS